MNKKSTCIIISTIVTVLTLLAFNSYWLQKGVLLRFRYEAEKDIDVQCFYCADATHTYSERTSVTARISKGKGKAEIYLPATQVGSLRIDLGQSPGIVKIHSIRIKGDKMIALDTTSFTPCNIEKFSSSEAGLTVNSSHVDPYVYYTRPLDAKAGQLHINLWNLFLCIVSPIYLCWVLGDIWNQHKNKNHIPNKQASLQNIEFLRILFTLVVLAHHFMGYYGIWNSGAYAVEFFFLLSGYLLALTFKPERSILEIAKQRWIRFVPLVVFGGILCQGEWKSFLGCIMMQNTGLTHGDIPNAPAWYIAILFWCMLFYLGLLKALPQRSCILCFAIIGFLAASMITHMPGDRLDLFADIWTRALLRGLSCMAFGIILAQCCRRTTGEIIPPAQKWCYTAAEASILVYIIWGTFDVRVCPESWIGMVLSLIALLYLFILKRGHLSSFFEHPCAAKVAKYSLAVYLTHWIFITTIVKIMHADYPGWLDSHPELCISIAMAGSWVIGILAHHLVEKPCTRYLTHFFDWMKNGQMTNRSTTPE